jgi:hypothetical protein
MDRRGTDFFIPCVEWPSLNRQGNAGIGKARMPSGRIFFHITWIGPARQGTAGRGVARQGTETPPHFF